jgi:hypothetical protein
MTHFDCPPDKTRFEKPKNTPPIVTLTVPVERTIQRILANTNAANSAFNKSI